MHGIIEVELDGAVRPFCIARHKQLFELQERCGVRATMPDGETRIVPSGPLEILTRLMTSTWRMDDVMQTIRLGLIGGGMSAADAQTLIRSAVEPAPISSFVKIAAAVLHAALHAPVGDDLGKMTAERVTTGTSDDVSPVPQPME